MLRAHLQAVENPPVAAAAPLHLFKNKQRLKNLVFHKFFVSFGHQEDFRYKMDRINDNTHTITSILTKMKHEHSEMTEKS